MQQTSPYLGPAVRITRPPSVTEQLTDQTATIAKLHETIAALQAQNAQYLETGQQTLAARLTLQNTLRSEKGELTKQVAALQNQNEALREDNQLLRRQNGILGAMNDELNEALYQAKQQPQPLGPSREQANELAGLKQQLAQSRQLNGAQAAEIAQLKDLLRTQSMQMAAMHHVIAQNQGPRGFSPGMTVVHVPGGSRMAPRRNH